MNENNDINYCVNEDLLLNSDRLQLLKLIDEYSFATTEAGLFLDTHPCDKKAMDYFNRNNFIRLKAIEIYTKRFGVLTKESYFACKDWNWASEPWPWEGECR